ncbi:MAG: DUF1579 family protein [Phycisphaerae bacterium]
MRKLSWVVLSVPWFAFGCVQPSMEDMTPKKPPAPPEMAKLEAWLGTWTGEGQMVEPSPEEMKKMMGPAAEDMPTTFKGGQKVERVLDGMFVREESWHEMPKGQREHFVGYYGWDARAKKYKAWFFSDWGGHGGGTMTLDKNGVWHMDFSSVDCRGNASSGTGTVRMIDDDNMEWTWTEKGPWGRMKMKGVSKRESK